MPSIGAYAVILAAVAGTTFASLFVVRRVSECIGAVVRPDERRVHERPTPTLGGVSMLLGVLVGMGVAWLMGSFDAIFEGSTEALGLVIAAVLIAVVGVIDDLRDVSAPAKIGFSAMASKPVSVLSLGLPSPLA